MAFKEGEFEFEPIEQADVFDEIALFLSEVHAPREEIFPAQGVQVRIAHYRLQRRLWSLGYLRCHDDP